MQLAGECGKAYPPGSTVTVSAELHGIWMNITVANNGPGLPPGQQDAVFEKFTRGERESAKPGVGLGLAICRAIAEAYGGTIWAETSPQGGAAFVFTLPLGTPPEMPVIDDEVEADEDHEFTGERCPVVEDESHIRRFVRDALEQEGWHVHEKTLRRGLIEAETRKPDLVIPDLGLPDGDGVDFITDLRIAARAHSASWRAIELKISSCSHLNRST